VKQKNYEFNLKVRSVSESFNSFEGKYCLETSSHFLNFRFFLNDISLFKENWILIHQTVELLTPMKINKMGSFNNILGI